MFLCPWSAYEDYCINYHRDAKSSRFKRHLCLIAWLSISEHSTKRLSSVSPPCFPNGPSLCSPSPSSHQSSRAHTELQSPGSSRENLLPSIINADKKRRASCLEQLSLLNITEHNQNPWMQILFSRPLNKKELGLSRGLNGCSRFQRALLMCAV